MPSATYLKIIGELNTSVLRYPSITQMQTVPRPENASHLGHFLARRIISTENCERERLVYKLFLTRNSNS